MIEEVFMALGAALWIAGELWAVRKGEDTTTSYVRRGKRLHGWKGAVVRSAAVIGTVWLFGHFVFDLWG